MNIAAPSVSIVVPVYNEVPARNVDSFTPKIRELIPLLRPCDEVVLVDGGSTDSSWVALCALASHPQITAIQSSKGRALQMNAGAVLAKNKVLLFLHADTVLPGAAWEEFLQHLLTCSSETVWGRFDVHIQGDNPWLPMVAWFMNKRSRLSKIGTGDQALFVGRELLAQLGGFPDQALMEDIELCKRLKRSAPQGFLPIGSNVITSGRRWDTHGAWSTIALMWRFRFLYWRGVPAAELARRYADTREKLPLVVAVFAKYPQAGRVKTRLEPLLGAEQCASFAKYLLLSTLDTLQGVNVALWTDGGTAEQWAELLAGRKLERHVQPQGHLGLRMQTAVEMHLKQSEVVVLLGPDAVQFRKGDLNDLVRVARKHPMAFVPALDGGYVALACTQCVPGVFSESIQWGTASVAEQTKAALRQVNVHAHWFVPQLDIDEPADFEKALRLGYVPFDWAAHYE